jgi:hypothetical protein
MPFIPTEPQNGEIVDADLLRNQFNGLKDLIDAGPAPEPETDPVFAASEAAKLVAGDKAKLDSTLGTSFSGDSLCFRNVSDCRTMVGILRMADGTLAVAMGESDNDENPFVGRSGVGPRLALSDGGADLVGINVNEDDWNGKPQTLSEALARIVAVLTALNGGNAP